MTGMPWEFYELLTWFVVIEGADDEESNFLEIFLRASSLLA
jgi:hypothetical protein